MTKLGDLNLLLEILSSLKIILLVKVLARESSGQNMSARTGLLLFTLQAWLSYLGLKVRVTSCIDVSPTSLD